MFNFTTTRVNHIPAELDAKTNYLVNDYFNALTDIEWKEHLEGKEDLHSAAAKELIQVQLNTALENAKEDISLFAGWFACFEQVIYSSEESNKIIAVYKMHSNKTLNGVLDCYKDAEENIPSSEEGVFESAGGIINLNDKTFTIIVNKYAMENLLDGSEVAFELAKETLKNNPEYEAPIREWLSI